MRHIAVLFCVLAAVSSCQRKHKRVETIQKSTEIARKANLYKSLHKGWSRSNCDSVGFTSLCKLAGGCESANLYDAEGSPGRWYRTPEKTCFDTGASASDISRDMFVMLTPWFVYNGQKDAVKRILRYAEANAMVMGRGDPFRTVMAPNMYLFYKQYTGQPFKMHPYSKFTTVDDINFTHHLDVVWALSKAMFSKSMSSSDLDMIESYAEENPKNALFQALYHSYTDGDQTKALEVLHDNRLFPPDRLPQPTDRCTHYLWQRDQNSNDWKACDASGEHDGVDFLFAAWAAGQI